MALLLARAQLTLALLLLMPGSAFAAAGGGSGGFGGGGGGGGGGFGGGGGGGGFGGGGGSGTGGTGGGVIFLILIVLVLIFIVPGVFAGRRAVRRRRAQRAERHTRVTAAGATAAEDDFWFAPTMVVAEATALFREIQDRWSENDVARLEQLVGADLMVEWRRRLEDFKAKGWRNRVKVLEDPRIQYVGIENRDDDTRDRVTVFIEAQLKDIVRTDSGQKITRTGEPENVTLTEYWTLLRGPSGWILESIQQEAEGDHVLKAQVVTEESEDVEGLRAEAVSELAAADAAGPAADVADLVSVDLADDAQAAALDLSLVDGRFAPDVLETAARQAASAWARAVDGADDALLEIATPDAAARLLHPAGDKTRLVVRGPRVEGIRISRLDGKSSPPAMDVEVALRGRRYVEDRDTATILQGSRDDEVAFTERWRMELIEDGAVPTLWRLSGVGAAASAA